MSNRRPRSCRIMRLVPVLIAALAPAAALAQPQFTWIALDQSPPGTPPTITLQTGSNLQQTVLDVTLHGFWYETIVQQSQTFRRISLDKLRDEALYRVVGRPELPGIVLSVAALVGVQPQPEPPVVQVLNEVTIPGAVIWPYQTPTVDHPGDPPPPFQWDQTFYQQTSTPYPAMVSQARGYLGRWSGLDILAAETYPFRAVPAAQQLKVAQHYLVTIPHTGTQTPQTTIITRRRGALYQRYVRNWTVVAPFRPMDFVTYRGDYLVICRPSAVDVVQPLVDQKRARGYRVTVATTDETGESCFFIREYIADWWAIDPTRDHYVLLVGEDTQIPFCSDENGGWSDHLYVCVDGTSADGFPDPLPEAHIGRLACQNDEECERMISNTLRYEGGPSTADFWLWNVVLTAHQEAVPGLYELCQIVVAGHDYAVQPTFVELYGGDGATNADVVDAVNNGAAIVCYRGHGSSTAWTNWNLAGEDFNPIGSGIHNLNKLPVVFAIACQNNRVTSGVPDCIGDDWLKGIRTLAVAHYGATENTGTEANHVLDLELFRAIYDDGVRVLGDVTLAGETAAMEEYPNSGESNFWSYCILGDPELEIWTQPPPPMAAVDVPAQVSTGPTTLTVRVKNNSTLAAAAAPRGPAGGPAGGPARASPRRWSAAVVDTSPVPFATVSVHKAGEVAESYYTNSSGVAQIPIDPSTPGALALTIYTELDPRAVLVDTVIVYDPAAAPGGPAAAGLQLSAPKPSPFRDRTAFSFRLPARGHVRVAVYDVRGTRVRGLLDGVRDAGEHALAWDGTDASGAPVGSGLYFIHLRSGEGVRVSRVARLR